LLIKDNTNATSLFLRSVELLLLRFWPENRKEYLTLYNAFHEKDTVYAQACHLSMLLFGPNSRYSLQQDTITSCKNVCSMTWKCIVFISFLITHYLFEVYLLIIHWLISWILYFVLRLVLGCLLRTATPETVNLFNVPHLISIFNFVTLDYVWLLFNEWSHFSFNNPSSSVWSKENFFPMV